MSLVWGYPTPYYVYKIYIIWKLFNDFFLHDIYSYKSHRLKSNLQLAT